MKLKSYNMLFRMFSYLSDKTNGAPFFVKYKLLLGTLILGLASSMSAEAQKKEAVRDTIPLRKPVPADITCYKPSVAVNVERDTVYEGKNFSEVVVEGYGVRKMVNLVSCYVARVYIDDDKKKIYPDDIYDRRISPKHEFSYYEIEAKPISPSGDLAAFQEWVQNSVNYTTQMQKDKVQGEVIISFVIDGKGRLVNEKVIWGLSEDAEKEVLRVLSSSKQWKSGRLAGLPVKTRMTIKVNFERN